MGGPCSLKGLAAVRTLTPAIELPNRALDVFEVADVCDCHVATVQREARRGKLRGTKVGSRWRFRPEDVAAYLEGLTPAERAERTSWDAYVRGVLDAAPELTAEQKDRIATLLRAGGGA
jgi:excisionase family DNA binding protein